MQISACNQLTGRVKAVNLGTVMAEVVLELNNGQELVSAITRHSAESLHRQRGDQVVAIIKATEVIIGKE